MLRAYIQLTTTDFNATPTLWSRVAWAVLVAQIVITLGMCWSVDEGFWGFFCLQYASLRRRLLGRSTSTLNFWSTGPLRFWYGWLEGSRVKVITVVWGSEFYLKHNSEFSFCIFQKCQWKTVMESGVREYPARDITLFNGFQSFQTTLWKHQSYCQIRHIKQ